MLFRNDETKEEREAREDIFGSKLLEPADEASTMEVDRPPTPRVTQNDPFIPPKQVLSIREPREIPQQYLAPVPPSLAQPAAAHVKMFGGGTGISPAETSPEAPVASSTPTAPPVESHHGPLSSTPFIRTAPAPAVPASGGSISAAAMPSVWRGAVAGEDGDEDDEIPEINIESDSE
jgi:hypothetical protein